MELLILQKIILYGVNKESNVIISGGIISYDGDDSSKGAIVLSNVGVVNLSITGGIISANNIERAIWHNSNGAVNIGTEGDLATNMPCINGIITGVRPSSSGATINVYSGRIENARGRAIETNSNLNISGGEISSSANTSTVVLGTQSNNSVLNMTGGIIRHEGTFSAIAVDARAGSPTINISEGKLVSTNGKGISCNIISESRVFSTPNININGGEINSKDTAIMGYYNIDENLYSIPTINITGGNLNSSEGRGIHIGKGEISICGNAKITSKFAGIYAKEGVISISTSQNSNISTDSVGPIIKSTARAGIVIDSGALTIGKGETNPSINTSLPSIIGEVYGVETGTATFNFYDGILKGKSGAVSGTPSIPAGYRRVDSTDSDGFKVVWLEREE